jgi:hypothetical protein
MSKKDEAKMTVVVAKNEEYEIHLLNLIQNAK